jgi:transposase
MPPARQLIRSPYDSDAHYAQKRTTSWVGYTVHGTETWEEAPPHLMTPVETTAGPVDDGAATPRIPHALCRQGVLPDLPSVDTGSLEAERLTTSQRDAGVHVLGPTRADGKWPAQAAQGGEASRCPIDGEQHPALCPQGRTSRSGTPAVEARPHEVVQMKCSLQDGQPGPSRISCTCAQRAGMEGTLSPGIRSYGLRRAREMGATQTCLQHVVTAVAINDVRMGNWLMEQPLAQTRTSTFERLMKRSGIG